MIVFDVDGTLIGGEAADWWSFRDAFLRVAGFELTQAFFDDLTEVTAQAIIHQALPDRALDDWKAVECAVRLEYLRNLKSSVERNPQCFQPVGGAVDLLNELKDSGVPIAIATGDWRETISFKLKSAGVSIDGIPMVTSSDHYTRADIIAAAVAKAGRPLSEALYVGDDAWDYRACRKLGIPFIGVGSRREILRSAGATHLLTDLHPPTFWPAHAAARSIV